VITFFEFRVFNSLIKSCTAQTPLPLHQNSANRNDFASDVSRVYEKIVVRVVQAIKAADTCSIVSRIVNQEARSRRSYDFRDDKGLPERKKTLLSCRETCSGKPESFAFADSFNRGSTRSQFRRSVHEGSDPDRLNLLQFALDAFADSGEKRWSVDDSFVGSSHAAGSRGFIPQTRTTTYKYISRRICFAICNADAPRYIIEDLYRVAHKRDNKLTNNK